LGINAIGLVLVHTLIDPNLDANMALGRLCPKSNVGNFYGREGATVSAMRQRLWSEKKRFVA
jgi:hypothetical protein